jgi:ATP-dependent Clp protease ATP-binding subunit ClpA
MTPPPSLQSLIDSVILDAGTDDPVGQLAVAAATAGDLEQTTDALLGHFVDRCRRDGRSWSEISAALGVTKQAVHKRFATPIAQRLAEVRGKPTFERFTQRARSVLHAAAAAAQASGHREVGSGHLLLGLYGEPDGVAGKALLDMQVSREQVGATLTQAWAQQAKDEPDRQSDTADGASPEEADATGRPPYAPDAREALLNAVAIALEFGHNYIGTEHILLALYRDPDSLAARVLAALGADRSEAQVRVTELLRGFRKAD